MNGLSVVIPIYNVEDYIEECLQTIVGSLNGFVNVQIILVNDGSKDRSGEIAQKYAKEQPTFHYVSKENGGLSDARNYGLKFVKYEYVTFIDSDDYITEFYFTEVFRALSKHPDLIIFDWMDIGDDGYRNRVKGMEFSDSLWTVQPSAWNKVYKTSLFTEVIFPKGKIYEDVGTIYKLLWYVKDYLYINKPLYMYRKNRAGSILTTISPKINDIYDALEDTYSFYKEKDALTKENVEGLCYQYVKILLWSNMYRQLKFYKFNFIGFYKKMKETRKLVYKYFNSWRLNSILLRNSTYFTNRFGENYISRLDKVGGGYFSTAYTICIVIIRNIRKR
ncbi:glycosyltransferase family 2 protein [Bacillus luteolus]|uniref:Glycosyltransferase family 2 protein n=1 Tax=Litchfieldia luteola TaxID=682179 RepID=A0ABR9QFH3_9BACI|nr:glycosyltransferase family 2 protein [Cytobacillus luteolus]MBE4907233.1 glycosyltransferase family 2 protein [Cytobacillus luteolus]MBP1943291.1 glycosyltransferase involved in cell wall biosynthesis [Cytobacillus luteolus]